MKRKIIACALAVAMAASTIGLTGCTEKDKVSWNVSQEAMTTSTHVRRLPR